MPSAGKSTLGALLAEQLQLGFIDTDLRIEKKEHSRLQTIVDTKGYAHLRHVEERELLKLDGRGKVIATGGSAVYSDAAMRHLRRTGSIVYLEISEPTMAARLLADGLGNRGLAKPEDQSVHAMYAERERLYRNYADVTINCDRKTPEEACAAICAALDMTPA